MAYSQQPGRETDRNITRISFSISYNSSIFSFKHKIVIPAIEVIFTQTIFRGYWTQVQNTKWQTNVHARNLVYFKFKRNFNTFFNLKFSIKSVVANCIHFSFIRFNHRHRYSSRKLSEAFWNQANTKKKNLEMYS